jgi:hypothetical protein
MTTTGDQLKSMLGDTALTFLSNLIQAKKDGAPLPKSLDKVASIAIQGQGKAIEIAKNEAKEQSIKQMSWIIVGVLTVIIVVLLIKEN